MFAVEQDVEVAHDEGVLSSDSFDDQYHQPTPSSRVGRIAKVAIGMAGAMAIVYGGQQAFGARTKVARVAALQDVAEKQTLTPEPDRQQFYSFENGEDFAMEEQDRKQNMHDGNPCGDEEELLAGLCYTKCSILLENADAKRIAPTICCDSPDQCYMPDHLHMSYIPCEGYDVGSQDGGHDCPHSPGLCLPDEDQYANMCFKSCRVLTNYEYPHRLSGVTCCKEKSLLSCLVPWNDKTSPAFDVGGGVGSEGAPHPPELQLTEG